MIPIYTYSIFMVLIDKCSTCIEHVFHFYTITKNFFIRDLSMKINCCIILYAIIKVSVLLTWNYKQKTQCMT